MTLEYRQHLRANDPQVLMRLSQRPKDPGHPSRDPTGRRDLASIASILTFTLTEQDRRLFLMYILSPDAQRIELTMGTLERNEKGTLELCRAKNSEEKASAIIKISPNHRGLVRARAYQRAAAKKIALNQPPQNVDQAVKQAVDHWPTAYDQENQDLLPYF